MALEHYSTQSLEQRLANRLLMLAGSFGVMSPQGLKIGLRLSQETLAQLIGATRQRVNTILKKWELDGIVEQRYGNILIRNKPRLEALAEN
jgi:CRP-like cAMP-binding protein